jgi:uncharacterized membrane protein (DUF2068 family)
MSRRRGAGVLLGIALFKLVKAAALIALGVGAFSLAKGQQSVSGLARIISEARMDPNNRLIHGALSTIAGLDARRLEALGVGTFIYAAVFLVEGSGLLLRKRWAEYLTSVVTASFVPLEIYEMAHKPSVTKALGIVLNVAIVIYLVVRLRLERREARS